MPKVDAKIELIRTLIVHEIERLDNLPLSADELGTRATRAARMEGLRFAIRKIDEVDERVR